VLLHSCATSCRWDSSQRKRSAQHSCGPNSASAASWEERRRWNNTAGYRGRAERGAAPRGGLDAGQALYGDDVAPGLAAREGAQQRQQRLEARAGAHLRRSRLGLWHAGQRSRWGAGCCTAACTGCCCAHASGQGPASFCTDRAAAVAGAHEHDALDVFAEGPRQRAVRGQQPAGRQAVAPARVAGVQEHQHVRALRAAVAAWARLLRAWWGRVGLG